MLKTCCRLQLIELSDKTALPHIIRKNVGTFIINKAINGLHLQQRDRTNLAKVCGSMQVAGDFFNCTQTLS